MTFGTKRIRFGVEEAKRPVYDSSQRLARKRLIPEDLRCRTRRNLYPAIFQRGAHPQDERFFEGRTDDLQSAYNNYKFHLAT
jgi:hypothetical protein